MNEIRNWKPIFTSYNLQKDKFFEDYKNYRLIAQDQDDNIELDIKLDSYLHRKIAYDYLSTAATIRLNAHYDIYGHADLPIKEVDDYINHNKHICVPATEISKAEYLYEVEPDWYVRAIKEYIFIQTIGLLNWLDEDGMVTIDGVEYIFIYHRRKR